MSLFLILLVTVATVFCQNYNPYYPQNYQNIPNNYRNQAYRSYQSYQQYPYVLNSQVSDGIWGGPTSLGWAQVPRTFSPQFSPVYGGK